MILQNWHEGEIILCTFIMYFNYMSFMSTTCALLQLFVNFNFLRILIFKFNSFPCVVMTLFSQTIGTKQTNNLPSYM